MARLNKTDLLEVVAASVNRAGWNALYLNRTHPFRLHIYNDDASYRVRIYIWNVTHGGGVRRPANEYRIQITGVTRFEPEPDGQTLILGWWNEMETFAAWDFRHHAGNLGRSPSLQIRRECLEDAYRSGFAPCLKENQEIAVAFRPDMLVTYIANLESLHRFGESPRDVDVLRSAIIDPYAVNETDLQQVPAARRVVVASIQTRLRASSFRSRVLTAYGHRCAFCGLQLDLVQAAHVLPVNVEGSTDDTSNGVAACYLHHAAYDRGLIAFDDGYRVLVNEKEMRRLQDKRRTEGKESFVASLKPLILLPSSLTDRPHVKYIRAANRARGWPPADGQ